MIRGSASRLVVGAPRISGLVLATVTTSPIRTRLHAIELAEQYWEHDRLTLRALTPAQRTAQLRARERLVHHARRVQLLLDTGQIPAGDRQQRYAADGIADLLQMLLEHARDEAESGSQPLRTARVPIPAPPEVWTGSAAPPPSPTTGDTADNSSAPTTATCRRCAGVLVRDPLAAALRRPIGQGWRHADCRKTHHPDPGLCPLA